MLSFLTNPYSDELFDSSSVIIGVKIGSYFSILAEKIGSQYLIENLLAKHII